MKEFDLEVIAWAIECFDHSGWLCDPLVSPR
jgi:hypothetical protein